MNVRLPIARPPEPQPETDDRDRGGPVRGGIDAEQLSRIQKRAEGFLREQGEAAADAMDAREREQRTLEARQQEILLARAIAARSQTIRAEGTSRLVMSVAGASIAALVLGRVLFGGRK